jgi:metal-responsive CopG/Arc/MetJ family transcriptional regulator
MVILNFMKTAISIPDALFQTADELADRLGMSRSELYQRAVRRFVEEHRDEEITAALNRVYENVDSSLDPFWAAIQAASLGDEEW